MNSKESKYYKRILSNTSSDSNNISINDSQATSARKQVSEGNHPRPGFNYNLPPENQPLLHQPTYDIEVDTVKRSDRTLGVDFGGFNSFGCSMSVNDINLTMNDEGAREREESFISDTSTLVSHNSIYTVWPVKKCTNISCDENSCLWHRCVLKLPQHVKWEDKTLTVYLKRNENESFGFTHKIKKHKQKDEIYFLVSTVDRDGKAAQSGLCVGDLMLSANAVSLQSNDKLPEINLKMQSELRLQIQHPLDLLPKAQAYIPRLAESMEINAQTIMPGVTMTEPQSPPTSPQCNEFYRNFPSAGESIPLSEIRHPRTTVKCHKLPQMRVFVCGNATNELLHNLFGDIIQFDSKVSCFEICMKKLENNTIQISNSESFTYLLEHPEDSCINVEILAVPDESFFHHCCSWMFTPRSLFIIVFDNKKLTQAPNIEMSRLCNIAHTIHSGLAGETPNILLYGLSSVNDNINPDEIRTPFYTSFGKLLPSPNLTSLSSANEMKAIRLSIFKTLTELSNKQNVIVQTAVSLDLIVSHTALTITPTLLIQTLQERNINRPEVSVELLSKVVGELTQTGNLLVTRSESEFIVPHVLYSQLSNLCICTENPRVTISEQDLYFKLCTTGVVTRLELQDILSQFVQDPDKLFSCLEDLHLTYSIASQYQDSGFEDNSSIFFPFFIVDVPFETPENYERQFTIESSGNFPCSAFYSLLSELSQTQDFQNFKMDGQFVAYVKMHDQDLCLHYKKTANQIIIFKKRSGSDSGKNPIAQLIHQIISRLVPRSAKVKLTLGDRSPSTDRCSAPLTLGDRSPSTDRCSAPEGAAANCGGASPTEGAASSVSLTGASMAYAIFDNKIEIPLHLLPGANAMSPPDLMEKAFIYVLDMSVVDLRFIHASMIPIFQQLSIQNAWESLAGNLGLTMQEIQLYTAMQHIRTSSLPAQTFLQLYFMETRCTLRNFLSALLLMREENPSMVELAENLWNAALAGNIPPHLRGHFNNFYHS